MKFARRRTALDNQELPFSPNHQISLAFAPQESNGPDVLEGEQAPVGWTDPDEMIDRSFGSARLVAGPELAVVTAIQPFEPRA